jgi:hypothetical protein
VGVSRTLPGLLTLKPSRNLPVAGVVVTVGLLLLAGVVDTAAAAAVAVAARVRCGWCWGGGRCGGGGGGRMGMGARALTVAVRGVDGGVGRVYSDRVTSRGCKSSSGALVPISLSMAWLPVPLLLSLLHPRALSTFA